MELESPKNKKPYHDTKTRETNDVTWQDKAALKSYLLAILPKRTEEINKCHDISALQRIGLEFYQPQVLKGFLISKKKEFGEVSSDEIMTLPKAQVYKQLIEVLNT